MMRFVDYNCYYKNTIYVRHNFLINYLENNNGKLGQQTGREDTEDIENKI